MDSVARMAPRDRKDVFGEAAARLGIRPVIVEKDFWVCVALRLLFERSRFGSSLVFKGGTSLSKAHGLIERFSEDIDLVLDWSVIGFGDGQEDPMWSFDSKSKEDRFNKELNQKAARFISETLCPELDRLLRGERIGLQAAVAETDPHVVNIQYPAAYSEAYIRPACLVGSVGDAHDSPIRSPRIASGVRESHLRSFGDRGRAYVLGEGHDSSSGSA